MNIDKHMAFCSRIVLLFFGCFILPCARGNDDVAVSRSVLRFTFPTDSHVQPSLSFYVLLPEKARGKPKCLYYATWKKEEASLNEQLLDSSSAVVRFARQNGFALITWETKHLRIANGTDLDLSKELSLVCQAWKEGVTKIAQELNFDASNGFGYGISRGGTYIQGLAVRHPEFFLGIHCHLGGFFEKTTNVPDSPISLITTGEFDSNCDLALQHYYRLRVAGSHPIFRCFQDLGHDSSVGTDALQTMFFEYLIELMHEAHDRKNVAKVLHEKKCLDARIVADIETNKVVTDRDSIFKLEAETTLKLQALPSAIFARRWAELDE